GQVRLLQFQRGQFTKAARNDDGNRRWWMSEQLSEDLDAHLRRNGSDALLQERLDPAQALAHAKARPYGPLKRQTATVRVHRLKVFRQVCQPFVGNRVVGFTGQA